MKWQPSRTRPSRYRPHIIFYFSFFTLSLLDSVVKRIQRLGEKYIFCRLHLLHYTAQSAMSEN